MEKERKKKRVPQKSCIDVNEEIRIIVKENGELEVQLKAENDEDVDLVEITSEDEEAVEKGWIRTGYFYNWSSCLKEIHSLLIVRHLLKKSKHNILELKEIFDKTHKVIVDWFCAYKMEE